MKDFLVIFKQKGTGKISVYWFKCNDEMEIFSQIPSTFGRTFNIESVTIKEFSPLRGRGLTHIISVTDKQ